jgi:glycosyltransferase involved in cell wall biosynthesis
MKLKIPRQKTLMPDPRPYRAHVLRMVYSSSRITVHPGTDAIQESIGISLTPDSKPPVLLVGNFLSASRGTRGVSEELAERLRDAEFHVIVTSAQTSRFMRLLDMLAVAWKKRSAYSVAVVEVYSGLAFIWAELVCSLLRIAKKPFIITLHGGNLPLFARKWPRRVKRLLNSAAVVTTPSSFLLEQMSCYRADLKWVPNPLDIKCYPFECRQASRPTLMWLRAFHRIYNPRMAARVLSHMVGEYPTARLTMFGPDKGDGSLQDTMREAEALDVTNRIEFAGPILKRDVGRALCTGDIFINTTNIDNTPVSVMEAMACGLCIVSTNVGGIPHLLENEHDALLVPPDDPQAMSMAIRRILEEPGLARRLSANARRKAEIFDWDVILPQWEALLESANRKSLNVRK